MIVYENEYVVAIVDRVWLARVLAEMYEVLAGPGWDVATVLVETVGGAGAKNMEFLVS